MADYPSGSFTPGSNPGLNIGQLPPGLQQMLLPLLMSFGPALINKLFGRDPQKELRKKVGALTSPANVGKVTEQFYQQNLASPAFSQAQGQIAAGANIASADVARNLAARGIGTTGTGAIIPGLQSSLVGSQQAGLRTQAHSSAQQSAQQQIQQQLQALYGTQGPSQNQQLFAGGLSAFSPYLTAYLRQQYPQTFGAIG
jgi:hypothetical protein